MERVRPATCAALAATLVLAAACGVSRSAPAGMPAPAPAPAGRWLVEAEGAMTPLREAALDAARDLGRSIAARLRLPRDITVRVGECGDARAGWLRETGEVRLCDETVQGVADALRGADSTSVLAGGAVAGGRAAGGGSDLLRSVTRFVLAQQLGRAVSDLLGLEAPDAEAAPGDEFAALFLLGDPALAHDVSSTARLLPLIGAVRGISAPGSSAPGSSAQQARADALLCLSQASGSDDEEDCRERLQARLAWWENRLGTVRLK